MDREQVAMLLDRYGNDVFRLAMSYMGQRQDAEDICQEVFCRLLGRDISPAPGKEKAFLLTCTANACKNQLKSFWRRNMGGLDDTVAFEAPEDRALYDTVMALPPKYRAVVHL